jgi:hypothetical protein
LLRRIRAGTRPRGDVRRGLGAGHLAGRRAGNPPCGVHRRGADAASGPALIPPPVITQARETAVAPLVRDISPVLLWHFDEAGWNVLGYEYAPGRHAGYSPGSPDLDRLVQLMDALSAI